MTVWVDNFGVPAKVEDKATGRSYAGRWSHLFADSKEELHEFAAKLGLKREWFQDKGDHLWHYDVTAAKRRKAVALGAQECNWKEAPSIMKRRGGRA